MRGWTWATLITATVVLGMMLGRSAGDFPPTASGGDTSGNTHRFGQEPITSSDVDTTSQFRPPIVRQTGQDATEPVAFAWSMSWENDTCHLDPRKFPPGRYMIAVTGRTDPLTETRVVALRGEATGASSNPIPIRISRGSNHHPGTNDVSARWVSRRAEQTTHPEHPDAESVPPPELPQERRFFWNGSSPVGNHLLIRSRLAATGRRVCVYEDLAINDADQKLHRARIAEIVRLLDEELLPAIKRDLGPIADIDGNGRLTVLITPQVRRLNSRGGTVDGCVRGADFHPAALPPVGNAADVLYLTDRPTPGLTPRTLLAHELTHAVHFTARYVIPDRPRPVEEDWIAEGVAHLTERHLGGDATNIAHRMRAFRNDPHRSPMIVPRTHEGGLWRHPGSRGAMVSFLTFCEQIAGPNFRRRLIRSGDHGLRSITRLTGRSSEELLRGWLIDIVRDPFVCPTPIAWTSNGKATEVSIRGTGTALFEWSVTDSPVDVGAVIDLHANGDLLPLVTVIRCPAVKFAERDRTPIR